MTTNEKYEELVREESKAHWAFQRFIQGQPWGDTKIIDRLYRESRIAEARLRNAVCPEAAK